ncbi:radical SAM protein [Candidatus Woesearchaeota archaeon]|nr:radical SAM protein [Candidatus Woesearchaeota archaeon]
MENTIFEKQKVMNIYTKRNNSCMNYFLVRITEKCNNNCIFCSAAHVRNNQSLSLENIKNMVDANADKKKGIEIGGAEPTLHKGFFKILEYCADKFKVITFTTNARMLCYRKFVSDLKKIPNLCIRCSIHGPNQEIHDSLTRTKGSFAQTIKGFANLSEMKIPFDVNIVITKSNVKYLSKTVDLLNSYNVSGIYFSGFMPISKKDIDLKLAVPFDELKAKIRDVLEYCIKLNIPFYIEKLPVCIAPEFSDSFIVESYKGHFTKVKECIGCIFINNCMGICKKYFEEGFFTEIFPVYK